MENKPINPKVKTKHRKFPVADPGFTKRERQLPRMGRNLLFRKSFAEKTTWIRLLKR